MGELVPGKRHLPKFYSVHHTAVDNQRNTAIGSICMVEQVVNHSPKVLTLRSQFFMNHHPQSFMNNSQLKDWLSIHDPLWISPNKKINFPSSILNHFQPQDWLSTLNPLWILLLNPLWTTLTKKIDSQSHLNYPQSLMNHSQQKNLISILNESLWTKLSLNPLWTTLKERTDSTWS